MLCAPSDNPSATTPLAPGNTRHTVGSARGAVFLSELCLSSHILCSLHPHLPFQQLPLVLPFFLLPRSLLAAL